MLTLAALAATLLASLAGIGSPAARAHLAFAIGIVPLIGAAMIHFVPVLTRTGEPARLIARLPLLAQAAGGLLVATLFGWLPYPTVALAAAVDAVVAAVLLGWILRRVRLCLGPAHPGWRWYVAALAALLLALLAAAGMALDPARWGAWRVVHLHLNLLGLIGLAAFGTLPLLLPTALNRPDPAATAWLQGWRWPAVAATAAVATGSLGFPPLALAGAGLWLLLALLLLHRWWRQFGGALRGDGAALALCAAVLGWVLCLIAAPLHLGGQGGRSLLLAWGALFLLPLVSGALSQLLPVWRWPGRDTPERALMRTRLKAGAGGRIAGFLLGGTALACDLQAVGALFVAGALLDFLLRVSLTVRIRRSTR